MDSFGIHFICEVEGELLITGDDTADIHWASMKDVQKLIDAHKFSEIDLPAVLMFLKDESDNMSEWDYELEQMPLTDVRN